MNAYRRELKYIVSRDILHDVRNRISPLMKRDIHQRGDFYRIRSIYFDSPDRICFRENKAGVSMREKYRIRTYDCNQDLLKAEIKIRQRDTISKMTARIDRNLLEILLRGKTADSVRILEEEISKRESDEEKKTLAKYMAKFATQFYGPACIVDYERCAYVYDICNVRITFDTNVMASRDYERMFDASLSGRAVLDNDLHVLEIKYDEFFPDEIAAVLGGMGLSRCSCSKYVLSMERMGVDG
ncbi:MAG: polyphosphate polymerase domain-containing protein [Lachnospiraceae bacterium]|nr:polyphosphate polymerase domain-containing protein [Lachnospiraceae bacterium]